ncbi:hypothetical protein GGS21DRAFT_488006 [Xylaria nigripes]|nr:hypothetical protein GGS21DRAFT_488006 [Xylaria nigripes]
MAQRLKELEDAVCNVVQIIKQIPELERLRIAVVGGLALWHYLADHRETDNIDFITGVSTPPSLVKRKLLEHPNSPFREEEQRLFYHSPAGWDIRIEFSPQWLFPYLPRAARFVRELLYGEVPYISLADLIVFKLDSSWLAASDDLPKKRQDGHDAAALLENEIAQHAANPERAENARTMICPSTTKVAEPVVRLSPRQENFVRDALCDMKQCGSRDKSWWEDCLGLSFRPGLGRSLTSSEPRYILGYSGMQGHAANEPNSESDEWDGYERLDGRVHVKYKKRANPAAQGPSWSHWNNNWSPWNGNWSPWNGPNVDDSNVSAATRPSLYTMMWPNTPPMNHCHHLGDISGRSSMNVSPYCTALREDYFGPYAGFTTPVPREDYFGPHASLIAAATASLDARVKTRTARSDSGYSSTGDCVCCCCSRYCSPGEMQYLPPGEATVELKAHFSANPREQPLRTVVEGASTDEQESHNA